MEPPKLHANRRTLWYCLWGAMAAFAFANAVMSYRLFSGRLFFIFGVALAATAAIQLAGGVPFLSRRQAALAAVVLILFIAAQPVQWLVRSSLRQQTPDFASYYVAGSLVAENQAQNLYQLPRYPDGRLGMFDASGSSVWQQAAHRYGIQVATPFIYPPLFAVVMRPFVYCSYWWAHRLWNALTVLLVLISVFLTLNLAEQRAGWAIAPVLIVGVLSYYPVFDEVLFGQVGGLVLLLWTLCAWLLLRRWIVASAFCFAFASMIKLTPLIAIPLFVFHRKWKWLIAYSCWILCLLGFSIWQAGWAAHVEFFNKVIPSISCGLPAIQNASLVGYIQELFVGHVFSVSKAPLAIPAMACRVSKAAAFVAYAAIMIRFYLLREGNLVRHLALATLLSLAISPISWWHHFTIALLPLVYLWCKMREPNRDMLLLVTTLVVGTNVAGFALMALSSHLTQLLVAAIVPCLTLALVYFRSPSNEQLLSVAQEVIL